MARTLVFVIQNRNTQSPTEIELLVVLLLVWVAQSEIHYLVELCVQAMRLTGWMF